MRKSGTLEKTPGSSNIYWIIGLLASINVIVHLLFSFNLDYQRDELLYFSLGLHPAFGYATVPPLIGWVAWAMQGWEELAAITDRTRHMITDKSAALIYCENYGQAGAITIAGRK